VALSQITQESNPFFDHSQLKYYVHRENENKKALDLISIGPFSNGPFFLRLSQVHMPQNIYKNKKP
jgi:hypothetical protein